MKAKFNDNVTLSPLQPDDREQFILDNQRRSSTEPPRSSVSVTTILKRTAKSSLVPPLRHQSTEAMQKPTAFSSTGSMLAVPLSV